MRKPGQRPLSPDDWTHAALTAIARGGVGAVAVETIAAELGATKGSFYWHFKNREALIQAALDRWERERTEAVIDDLERESDPAVRLRKLLGATFKRAPSDRAEIALLANPGHPAALHAVRRAAERRVAYISQQLEALGWTHVEAHDRAVLLYYIYVGYLQMAHVAPEVISGGGDQRRQAALVFDALAASQLATDAGPSAPPGSHGDA